MIPVYDVQTFYGTHQKTFQRSYNAEKYFNQLAKEYDPDLIEVYKRNVTEEEFCYENIED